MTSSPQRPQRRQGLYARTVRGRFVVLDAERRTLTELQPELTDLWPLLDGELEIAELAERWAVTADMDGDEASQVVEAVVQELAATSLLTNDDQD